MLRYRKVIPTDFQMAHGFKMENVYTCQESLFLYVSMNYKWGNWMIVRSYGVGHFRSPYEAPVRSSYSSDHIIQTVQISCIFLFICYHIHYIYIYTYIYISIYLYLCIYARICIDLRYVIFLWYYWTWGYQWWVVSWLLGLFHRGSSWFHKCKKGFSSKSYGY